MQLDEGNKSIVPFLRKKRMLALGCKFDNWYFRFFWYIITRGFGIRDRDGNPNTIDNPFRELILSRRREGGIFISSNLSELFSKKELVRKEADDASFRTNSFCDSNRCEPYSG